jgi:penicillin-binding protein 1C
MEKNPNQDPNLNSNPRPNPSDETPAQRLRRILANSQRKRDPQPSAPQDSPQSTPAAVEPQTPAADQALPLADGELPDELPVDLPEEAPLQKSDTQPIPVISPQQARAENSNSQITPRELLHDIGQEIRQVFSSLLKKNRPLKSGKTAPSKKVKRASAPSDRPPRKPLSCLLNAVIVGLFGVVAAGILALSFIIIQYFVIAANLPSVDDLRSYASQFQTTTIYDRDGSLIYEILDPNAGRRTYTTLDHISPALIAATIATEDKDFYTNPGFDPWGILRAFWQNYTHGEVVSGASTITQQLARALLLSPEERSQITTQRKAREIVLAAEITRRYSKDEILELYLNEIYYGNLAYGVEAAAETYFNVSAGQLDLAQASFLAGLPQAPAVYDIFTNRQAALLRHTDVLGLMTQLSSERDCISVNQSAQPVCVSVQDAVTAAQAINAFPFVQRVVSMPYPHWVNYIRAQLETQFEPQTIYRSGFKVYTTLDPKLQDYAQATIQSQVAALVNNNASDGALVAIQPASGQILAMVGSADFYNEAISGQVNMAVALRQPGSSIKPLTYAAAFEKGWTPATLIWDVPSEFPPSGDPADTRDPYKPVNYDGKYHGPLLARAALANSYNIPAVKTLAFVGIYDNPATPEKDGFISFAERMGISTFTRDDYGLSLTLGGGDVTLLELTGAFAVFANGGLRAAPYAIERIEDHDGNIIYRHEVSDESRQVISTDHAYLISSILSDNAARTPAFGANSVLKLPFTAAVKTGTTNDFRDNWTLGYTPDIAIGVWIGNADYTPMINVSGVAGAAPVWADVMQWAIDRYTGGNPARFIRPEGVEEKVICSTTGAEPSDRCKDEKTEIFAKGQPPLKAEDDIWKEVKIDTWTGLQAGPACTEFAEEKFTLNVSDPWARKWLTQDETGKAWAKSMGFSEPLFFTPEDECDGSSPRPTIVFVGLKEDDVITEPELDIYAVADASRNFKQFKLQVGVGDNPTKWKTLLKSSQSFDQPQKLVTWDASEAGASRITLRIYMESTKNTYAEKRIHLNLQLPEPEPTDEPLPTETPELPASTETPLPPVTATPEPTSLPTSETVEAGMLTPIP